MSKTPNTLEKVRAAITSRQATLRDIMRLRRSRAEVGAYIDATVERWDAEGLRQHGSALAASASGQPAEFLTVMVAANTPAGPLMLSVPLGPVLVQVLGAERVRTALCEHLALVPPGVDSADRPRMLAKLEADIEKLSGDEEGLMRAALETGENVAPRGDADPRHALTWRPPA